MTDEAMNKVDHVIQEGRWEFNREVVRVFDNMLERSIPQYEIMRSAVLNLARKFIKPHTWVIDLGCSQGEALAPLVANYGDQNYFVGVDASEPMLELAKARFQGMIQAGVVKIDKCDLRYAFPPQENASVFLAILTLMFIPLEYRQSMVLNSYNHLIDGGAFIIVDKVLGETAELNELFVEQYLEKKRRSGYAEEEIDRKRLSLEGVLMPITPTWEVMLLRSAGFRYVDCFWKWMNFGGWIAIK